MATWREVAEKMAGTLPDGAVAYSGGFEVDLDDEADFDSICDPAGPRTVYVWESEEDSVDDDGANAIATISPEDV